ncbi:MAG: hypothetical protein NVS4B12_14370 [Ktedonobacteraceae bacterium]
MGIYLGQLPPAEVARLKAELAETIIAYFCYPRFFDYRTDSLRMRPVDRAKRQEVWLYLSSVDFTAWNRIDLMSPDFQHSIERLFIQFVQRNRSFFGEQGRKRMSDVRMLISTTSTTVVQGLRNHVTGQRQGIPPFGSPRQAIVWSAAGKGRSDPAWEQIVATTMLLQQQLQEIRSEVKTPSQTNDGLPTPITGGIQRKANRGSSARVEQESPRSAPQPTVSKATVQKNTHTTSPLQGTKSTTPLNPTSLPNVVAYRPTTTGAPSASVAPPTPAPAREQDVTTPAIPTMDEPLTETPTPTKEPIGTSHSVAPVATLPPKSSVTPVVPVAPTEDAFGLSQATAPTAPVVVSSSTVSKRENRDGAMMQVGDDDIAIFEQMRHQLIIWLRVEAIHSGLEIADQSPSQLLEMLRCQERYDDTRLQVVSTLLNLSNQVIKNARVSVLDYKQALMFHLMHTRR